MSTLIILCLLAVSVVKESVGDEVPLSRQYPLDPSNRNPYNGWMNNYNANANANAYANRVPPGAMPVTSFSFGSPYDPNAVYSNRPIAFPQPERPWPGNSGGYYPSPYNNAYPGSPSYLRSSRSAAAAAAVAGDNSRPVISQVPLSQSPPLQTPNLQVAPLPNGTNA